MHLLSRQLPCGHKYCKSCIDVLRQKGADKSCPLCRKMLPPGAEMLFHLGSGMYTKIRCAIGRSRPRVDARDPWPALSTRQQQEMNQAAAMLREAADQGLMKAQWTCAELYAFGFGVAKDEGLAFLYNEKAAKQGWVVSQYNLGLRYGVPGGCRGCQQNYGRAAEWFEKAALQGHTRAQNSLGLAYRQGRGVQQSDERAAEWFEKAALRGHANAQHSLGTLYYFGRGVQ